MAAVNDILRATGSVDLPNAVEAQMVHHYRVSAGSESDYAAIATAIESNWSTAYTPLLGEIDNGISANFVRVAEWDFTANEWDGKAEVAANFYDGTNVGEMVSHGVAALLRFITLELRRQGRKFLPGFTETAIIQGAWTGTHLGLLVTLAAFLDNPFAAGGVTLQPCTFNDTPTSPRFETHSDFSGTSLVNTFASYQRRRRPGVGI